MLFFSIQGPLLIAEAWLNRVLHDADVRFPRAVRIATTTTTLHMCKRRFPH
jgi:hypothetical protein